MKLDTSFWLPAFTAARCVVPMRGYFEWTGEKGDKTPHFLQGDRLLSAAGLTWSMEHSNGERSRCFVVVTRDARDAGGEVHDRMPTFLTDEGIEAWLDPAKLDWRGRDEMLSLLDDASIEIAATIRSHVVDRKINNSRTVDETDPSIVRPVT